MPQRLPVFRAARLVGVSRNSLQKKIREQGIETFEGSIDLSDLMALYPKVDLGHDSEYERVQHIKATAFAKRVRERVMPDAEILASRLEEVGHDLADTQRQLSKYRNILAQVLKRLSTFDGNRTKSEYEQKIKALLHWINTNLETPDSN